MQIITNKGLSFPDTETIKNDVIDTYSAVLPDLILEDGTPQGQLINMDTATLQKIYEYLAYIISQYDVNSSTGVFLDAMYSNFGIKRIKDSYSTVTVRFTGTPLRLIPIGTIVANSQNNEFVTIEEKTITSSGVVDIACRAVDLGEIPVIANSITILSSPIPGVSSVNNPIQGVLGSSVESDPIFRLRGKRTMGKYSIGTLKSIESAVYDVEGVTSCFLTENVENIDKVITNKTLVPHSVYLCVQGGSDVDIAEALFINKSVGSQYNGSVEVQLLKSDVIYTVKFDRPQIEPVAVVIELNENIEQVYEKQTIKEKVVEFITTFLPIGQSLVPSDIVGYLYDNLPGVRLKSLKAGKLSGGQVFYEPTSANIDTLFTCDIENVEVN